MGPPRSPNEKPLSRRPSWCTSAASWYSRRTTARQTNRSRSSRVSRGPTTSAARSRRPSRQGVRSPPGSTRPMSGMRWRLVHSRSSRNASAAPASRAKSARTQARILGARVRSCATFRSQQGQLRWKGRRCTPNGLSKTGSVSSPIVTLHPVVTARPCRRASCCSSDSISSSSSGPWSRAGRAAGRSRETSNPSTCWERIRSSLISGPPRKRKPPGPQRTEPAASAPRRPCSGRPPHRSGPSAHRGTRRSRT